MTPEATVIRLLRLCQEAEMAENGLNPNNAMLYAFTNKMKKMKQKKFQNFPKIQRRRTRRVGVSIFIQKIKQAKVIIHHPKVIISLFSPETTSI